MEMNQVGRRIWLTFLAPLSILTFVCMIIEGSPGRVGQLWMWPAEARTTVVGLETQAPADEALPRPVILRSALSIWPKAAPLVKLLKLCDAIASAQGIQPKNDLRSIDKQLGPWMERFPIKPPTAKKRVPDTRNYNACRSRR